jgi:hypothetical protein
LSLGQHLPTLCWRTHFYETCLQFSRNP